MARERDNFVISDVDSFYFGGEGDEDDVLTGEDLTSYIYTDRPIYRPAQKIYFKGILRQWGRDGYQLLESKTVNVTIEDPNNGKDLRKGFAVFSARHLQRRNRFRRRSAARQL